MRKILSILLLILAVFASCDHDSESQLYRVDKLELGTHVLRLSDDTTGIAGKFVISANTPEVKLKWNVPSTCNIDTTVTSLCLYNGSAELSVKWNECISDNVYGPIDKAFDAGVLISSNGLSEYVHLIWAEQVDSTVIEKISDPIQARTRAGEEIPAAIVLTLHPELVPLDIVVGGSIFVDYSGIPIVTVDQTDIPVSTNIDKGRIPRFLTKPDEVVFDWTTAGPPDINFTSLITFTAGSIRKQATLVYNDPSDEPSYWLFVNSTPDSGSPLPATNASVVVTAKTNKDWSIESDDAILSPVKDNGGTPLGNKTLSISINDNPSLTPRTITVLVKSQNSLKETLIFNQLGNNQTGVFDFLSSNPVAESVLPGEETSVDITVQTDLAWWIKCNCGKRMDYPASALGEKTGTVTVTENKTGAPRIVTVTVGYGDTTVKTLSFVQNVSGATDPSATLVYDSSTLPNGNIPQDGGTYTFTFTGTYTGEVQVRTLIDGVAQTPGTSVTNKQPQASVPANTLATTRNITFQYKRLEGDWTALPASTNRTQDSGNGSGGDTETLTYVSSNLPVGNIPATATVYTFEFQGSYTGQFRVRSVDATTGAVLFNGPIGTTHSPKVTVPANTSTDTRNIKFQYRLIDIPNSPWLDVSMGTDRIQDGSTSGGNIEASATLTPGGNIPEDGYTYTCTFTGGSGNVILRAMKKRVNSNTWTEAVRSASTAVPGDISVTVPELSGLNATISFEYSTDGGNTWIAIDDNRNQLNTWILIDYPSSETIVAATNGSISFGLRGNVKQPITIYVSSEGREIGRATGYAPGTLIVPVEDNPSSSPRYIIYKHQTIDGEAWVSDVLTQAGK
ncbi:hypothetical protein [Bacteroides sp.]|uniref:hypothetical protein n=1 Tax=Bacteroides sp. TaxID=29523 RepID=UPI002A819302|nr:hypothetical protein [Bacteroides sp.]